MTLKLALVPSWKHAYKWFSMQCAAGLVLLATVQTIAQEFESSSYLADVTRSTWYHALMTFIAAATILLRLVHQPVAAVEEQPVNPPPPPEPSA